jgi:hypothetical protein
MDRVPLWRGNHALVKQLADDFARYLYLPRLRDREVLAEAIAGGLGLISWTQDSFAYADGWDEQNQRYRGLQVGRRIKINIDGDGLLVKACVAAPQLAEQQQPADPSKPAGNGHREPDSEEKIETPAASSTQPEPPPARRYHGSVSIDPLRIGRDVAAVADEIVQHLTKQPGAKVEVTLEIRAEIANGAPEDIVRTVCENSRKLKFASFDFENK